jgi:hypothetical protein
MGRRAVGVAIGAVFVVASWIVLPGVAGRLATPEGPTLNIVYHDNGSITVALPDGTRVGAARAPGTVIPAGTYNIVFDPSSRAIHQFHIQGPGVSFTVGPGDASDGMCGGSGYLYGPFKVTFQPNSTYVYQDDYQPDVIRQVFSTSSTVAAGGSAGASGSGAGSGAPKAKGSGGIITGTPLFGAGSGGGSVSFRGALTANVDTRGRLSLSRQGRAVASLAAGRYRITVRDETAKAGFVVQRQGQKALTISAVGSVGKRSLLVQLRAGQWSFYSPSGKKTHFRVVT